MILDVERELRVTAEEWGCLLVESAAGLEQHRVSSWRSISVGDGELIRYAYDSWEEHELIDL